MRIDIIKIMMDVNKIKKNVYEINYKLSKSSLVIQNFGNASARFNNSFIIKPSGIDLEEHNFSDMVQMDFSGNLIDGNLNPSSDEPTHRVLYSEDKNIGGIVHTHSKYASAFAQANLEIKNFGTTHSDFSIASIFVTDQLSEEQVQNDYEKNTGIKIIEKIKSKNLSLLDVPGMLSIRHGVFSWGKDIYQAYKNAEIIEYIAELCFITQQINPSAKEVESYISNKHFLRKHGPEKYYGQ